MPKGGGGWGALVEGASTCKTCFRPGPRSAQDAFNQGAFINQELTLIVIV